MCEGVVVDYDQYFGWVKVEWYGLGGCYDVVYVVVGVGD